jgi:hypothetical protein
MPEKTWNFAVVGLRPNNMPKYLGFTDTYEEAVELQGNMTALGWTSVTIYDPSLQPVKAKP